MFVFENELNVRPGYGEHARNRLQAQRPTGVPGMIDFEVFTRGTAEACEQICIRSVWASREQFQAFMQSKDFQLTHCGKCLPYLMQYRIRLYAKESQEAAPVAH